MSGQLWGRISARYAGKILVAREQAGSIALLVGRIGKTGLTVDRVSSMPLASEADRAAIATMTAKLKCDVIAVLVPAVRTATSLPKVEAPSGSESEVASAMALLAEAHLPGTYPPHRRAGVVLAATGVSATSPPARTALVLGWTGTAEPLGLPRVDVWIPELCVLAFAAGNSGTPCRFAAIADATTGGLAAIDLSPAGPAKVRSTVIGSAAPAGSADAQATLDSAAARLSAADGSAPHAGPQLVRDDASGLMLALPADVCRRALQFAGQQGTAVVSGESGSSAASPQTHTLATSSAQSACVALAAILMATASPLHAGLEMSDFPPAARTSTPVRIIAALGRPRIAAACILGALILLAGSPIAFAYARLNTLRTAAAAAGSGDEPVVQARQQLELYDLLTTKRWPMTRLLAEIASAAPQGVLVDSVSIEHGKRILIGGSFGDTSQVNEFREALAKNRVLEDVRNPSTETSSARFQLNAQVATGAIVAMGGKAAKPATTTVSTTASAPGTTGATGSTGTTGTQNAGTQAAAAGANSATPAAGASNNRTTGGTRNATPASTEPRRGTRATGQTGAGQQTTGASGAGASSATNAPPAATKRVVPAPLSDGAIAALDRKGAMGEWAARRGASQWPEIDETTRQRLIDEAAKAQARMQAAAAEAPAAEAGSPK